MGDRWESESSSRGYGRIYNQRREGRRETDREGRRPRDNQFYRYSNRSFGKNWNNDSSTQNYNNDSYRRSNDGNGSDGTNRFVMYIDTNSVGKLIGKGGSKIKALQEESSAKISVDKQYDGNGQTAVTLTGSDDAQQRAKSLIEELLIDKRIPSSRSTYRSSGNVSSEDPAVPSHSSE